MKLDIVSPFPPAITGIGQYGYHVSRSLEKSGLFSKITVLAGAPPASEDVLCSSPTTSVEYAWVPDRPQTFGAIPGGIRARRPDLVWFNIGASVFGRRPLSNLLGLLTVQEVRLSGYPTVVTLHEMVELADLKTLRAPGGIFARWGARLLTRLATRADVVCLTMRRYTDWLARQSPHIRSQTIPIGAYQAPAMLPEPDRPELLFFTTLAPYKGLEILLEAYRALLPAFPALRLTIAGTEHPRFPGYARCIQEACRSLPAVRFLGQVPESGLTALYAASLIVVLPYLASTGSSSVLYQAAAWGRALVSSDIPETAAVAAESGLQVGFYKASDPAALALALRALLESPGLRRAQADHNFRALQTIRPEDTCARYLRAFNLALETRHHPMRLAIPENVPREVA